MKARHLTFGAGQKSPQEIDDKGHELEKEREIHGVWRVGQGGKVAFYYSRATIQQVIHFVKTLGKVLMLSDLAQDSGQSWNNRIPGGS